MIDMFNLGLPVALDDKIRQRMIQLEALHRRAEELLAEIKAATGRMVTSTVNTAGGTINGNSSTSPDTTNRVSFYHVDAPYPRRPN